MDRETKKYIDGLDIGSIPWNRMFTAYGTAENYAGLLQELGEIRDLGQWKKTFSRISDFEHQSTMFPPAPFALVFLVRILRKLIEDGDADDIAAKLIDQFTYYADVCSDAEEMEHAEPLGSFEDLLDDGNLLPEDPTEDDLMAVYEDPDAVPPKRCDDESAEEESSDVTFDEYGNLLLQK